MKAIVCSNCGAEYSVPSQKPRRKPNSTFVLTPDDYVVCSCSCWIWKWSVNDTNGYGIVRHDEKKQYVNRIQLNIVNTDLFACHNCDTRRCVNPDHLYVGTPLTNMRDMYARGRANRPFGSNTASARLTEDDVLAIRAEYAAGGITQANLADKYGVAASHLSHIITGRKWKHI